MDSSPDLQGLRNYAKDDPVAYWSEAAAMVDWMIEPETILDDSRPPYYRWYRGGVMNTCYNAVDRWVDAVAEIRSR